MERRLTAILAADVVGCSRLMGADEVGTLAALKTARAEVIDSKITEREWHIVKLAGDGSSDSGPRMRDWIRNDSDLDGIRSHPRFQKLLEQIG